MGKIINIGFVLLLVTASVAFAQLDVPFYKTDSAVVDSMLSAAGAGKNDIVYDLGCGDGRIVIAAAKKYGVKKAVGIDLDPERIKDSNENARKEKVTDLVEFRQGDIFNTDFSDATVVTMYLLNSVNLRLRPILFETLKPGTRIVSHDFHMGDWEPDRTIRIQGVDHDPTVPESHVAYFWVLPANVSGDWAFTANNLPCTLHVFQKYQVVSGTMDIGENTVNITDMNLNGGAIQFTARVSMKTGTVQYQFKGSADGNTMTGTVAWGQASQAWTAARDQQTIRQITTKVDQSHLQLQQDYLGNFSRKAIVDTTTTFERW